MSSRKWLKILLISSIIIFGIPAAAIMYFNYLVDPLWNFNHENEFNELQAGFNERQQKTNYITNNDFNYESLLIGTSRTTYMNQYKFKTKTYNYGLSGQAIMEYPYYIDYAKSLNGKDFKYIYMELSFSSFKKDAKMPLGINDNLRMYRND